MPGMTASYSHGGPEWNLKLRGARSVKLENAYPFSYKGSHGPQAEAVGDANLLGKVVTQSRIELQKYCAHEMAPAFFPLEPRRRQDAL